MQEILAIINADIPNQTDKVRSARESQIVWRTENMKISENKPKEFKQKSISRHCIHVDATLHERHVPTGNKRNIRHNKDNDLVVQI